VGILCAVAMAFLASPAAAEPPPVYAPPLTFPTIESSADPEDYSWLVELGPGETLTQVSPIEAVIESAGEIKEQIFVRGAHDAINTSVPTTLAVAEGDVLTLTVHHLSGAFVYPVSPSPWILIKEEDITPAAIPVAEDHGTPNEYESHWAKPTMPDTATCHVPALRGLALRAAKTRLRAAHCSIGQVHLATGATTGKGKVVRQFRAAGTELVAGAPIAVKLGSR
jgi:PASTA domain-containing protein